MPIQFLHDGSGQLSSTRLLMLVWGFGVLFVWGYLSLKAGSVLDIPVGLAGAFGAVLALKATQSFSPNDQANH